VVVVNFKTYKEATGYRAINLANICRRVQEDTKVRVVAAVQVADLRNCVESGADCWVQHVDPVEQGKTTGWVTYEDVEQAGAKGTLLNHSEHKLDVMTLENTMRIIGELAFEACICAGSVPEAESVASLKPDFIAYEPPELIASTEASVASSRPDVVEEVVKKVTYPVLIGAGVKSAEDVKIGLKLGAHGILVSSYVVLAHDPESVLRELALAFKM
jgi:triosephosphate isomerase